MQDTLCELRFDVPLTADLSPRQFEKNWRALLAAQKMTALAMPPAHAVAARFRVCGPDVDGEHPSPLQPYLMARLSALPGTPTVAADPPLASSNWRGVKVWLSFRADALPALLQSSKLPKKKPIFPHFRGQRS